MDKYKKWRQPAWHGTAHCMVGRVRLSVGVCYVIGLAGQSDFHAYSCLLVVWGVEEGSGREKISTVQGHIPSDSQQSQSIFQLCEVRKVYQFWDVNQK
jgi:hypothetical protein